MNIANWLASTTAAALMVGGILAPKAQAAEPAPRPQAHRGQWLERVKDKLGLTDEQIQKIKAELVAEKQPLKDLISNLHQSRIALREAIQAPDANETTVRAAAAKVATVEADLAVERLKLYARISPILTSEQLEKLKEFRTRLDEAIDRVIERVDQRLSSE
jgi:Spy/CpxP family protein refolding chaperone